MNLSKNSEPSFHMTLKKKRILTFLCALWPGGGYMYFGMMKKGALLMSLFTATAGLTQTVGPRGASNGMCRKNSSTR